MGIDAQAWRVLNDRLRAAVMFRREDLAAAQNNLSTASYRLAQFERRSAENEAADR